MGRGSPAASSVVYYCSDSVVPSLLAWTRSFEPGPRLQHHRPSPLQFGTISSTAFLWTVAVILRMEASQNSDPDISSDFRDHLFVVLEQCLLLIDTARQFEI
jgi:hypothetical protein